MENRSLDKFSFNMRYYTMVFSYGMKILVYIMCVSLLWGMSDKTNFHYFQTPKRPPEKVDVYLYKQILLMKFPPKNKEA